MRKKFLAAVLACALVFALVPAIPAVSFDVRDIEILDIVHYYIDISDPPPDDVGDGKIAITVPNPFNFPGLTLAYVAFYYDGVGVLEEIEVVDLGEDGIKIIFTKEQNEIWLIAFEVCADCLRSPCVCIIFEIWGCFFCGGEDHKGLCSNIEGITASIWIDDNGIKLEGSNEYDTIISIENVEKLEISINFIDDADSYDFIKGYEIRPFYDKVRVISLGKHKLAITIPNPFDFPELITAYGVNTNPFIKNVELVEIDFFIVHANNTITFIITDDLFFIILVGDPPFPGFCSYCGEVSCECKEEPAVCADCEKVSCECKKEPAVCADCEKVSCECKEEPELQPETPELPPDDIKISVVSEIPGVLATISPGLMISIAGGEPFKADPDKLTLKVEKKTPKNTEAFFTALLAYLK